MIAHWHPCLRCHEESLCAGDCTRIDDMGEPVDLCAACSRERTTERWMIEYLTARVPDKIIDDLEAGLWRNRGIPIRLDPP